MGLIIFYYSDTKIESSKVILLSELCENMNGFTCTGMTYDKQRFYIGNIGKETPESQGFHSEIIVCDEKFTEIVDRIDIGTIFPDMKDIQGIAIDTSDNSIWFCSFSENLVRHIDNNKNEMNSFSINQPTGIAYDKSNDCIWVLTYSELFRINKITGEEEKSYPCELKGQDQLCWDDNSGNLLITAGLNYSGSNFVYEFQIETEIIQKKYRLIDSNAIEGIVVVDGSMYIANDGYYHNAKSPYNQINIYDLSD